MQLTQRNQLSAATYFIVFTCQSVPTTHVPRRPCQSCIMTHLESFDSHVSGDTEVLPPQTKNIYETSYQQNLHQKTISTRKSFWGNDSSP